MIITIQPLKKGHLVHMIDKYVFEYDTLQDVTKTLGTFSDELHKKTGVRPVIKMLSIKHTPMKSKTASTNPGNKMSTASTDKSWRPAKKKAVAKAKKAIKKPTKK